MKQEEKQITSEEVEKEAQERYEKELKERPPFYLDALPLKPGEIVYSKLSEEERFQVLTRYLGDICVFTKSQLQIIADQYILIEFLCKKLGVDVKAEKAELTKQLKLQKEQELEKSKQDLINAAKNA